MKAAAVIMIIAVMLYACSLQKDIQVRSVTATVVKIDTVSRCDGGRAWIYWIADKVMYSQMERLPVSVNVGDQKQILVR
jgi:hypothetical protein